MLTELCPDLMLAVETFESPNNRLSDIINQEYRYLSMFRDNSILGKSGGGVTLFFNEVRFTVRRADYIDIPHGIEAVWAIVEPKENSKLLKKLCIGVIYIAPRSKFKSETIQHIIETIHVIRAKHNNEINYCIFGDFNKVPVDDVIDAYGVLQQVVKVPTRKDEILDLILTDLHTDYHSPVSLPPLEVDPEAQGKDSDHNVVLFPPIPDRKTYASNKSHKTITTRPLPHAQSNGQSHLGRSFISELT